MEIWFFIVLVLAMFATFNIGRLFGRIEATVHLLKNLTKKS